MIDINNSYSPGIRFIPASLCLLVFALLLLSGLTAEAQVPKSFSENPEVFFKELTGYLAYYNKKEADRLNDEFENIWLVEKRFTPEQQSIVIQTANVMLKKRMKPFPDFSNYLTALMALVRSDKAESVFTNWHISLDKMLALSARRYSDYIENVSGLFSENTLNASASVQWIAGSSAFTFEFDSVPRITFPTMDLVCRSKGDSSYISGITGSYYPLTKSFIGQGGRVYWTRAGLEPASVYAELGETTIDLKGSEWQSDAAVFYNTKFFKSPLKGKVTDKILANITPQNAGYPRFSSFDLKLSIREIVKDADFLGGFAQHGSKMIGTGSKDEKATLTFRRKNLPFMVISARSFVVRPDRISSDNASVVFYHDGDSIYHPAVEMKYVNDDRMLSLIRPLNEGISMPFFNSFHKVDLYAEAIYWKIDDPLMEIKNVSGQSESRVLLESANLYTDERYQKIQGLADVSPLFTIKQYAEKNSRYIYSPELAAHLRVSEQQARSLLIFLANKGFLSYDFEEDVAQVNDKLYYYLAARSNKTDYDKIEIESIISARPNAKLNLLNFQLDLQGVGRVLLSDSQQVWIAPANQELHLFRNRDMEFSGRIHAGRSDFYGKNFKFYYDGFQLDLGLVDSIRLKVESKDEFDEYGRPKLIALKSTLQNVSGQLQIDSLDNKSSRKYYPGFPRFTSTREAYIYYDHTSLFNGVYKRDKFYFRMDPFTIDSLDNFAEAGMKFTGVFESGGIFPTLPEVAVIRSDYSFGFEKDAPGEGYPLYGGKGRYFRHIDLSFEGLRGDGQIDYLSSTAVSKDIIFFIDATNMNQAAWDIRRSVLAGTGFPQAEGDETAINWRVKEDRMHIMKTQTDLKIFEGKVLLDGNLQLTPVGLEGDGKAKYMESALISNQFRFEQDAYRADTADFQLMSDEDGQLALNTKNVKAKIDLMKRFGEFRSNGEGSYVIFPINQYMCYISRFRWLIDSRELAFGSDPSEPSKSVMEGTDFVSTHPGQDSLRWTAGQARYSLKEYRIKANQVKEILVADAALQPADTGTIIIEKNAVMRPLYAATITANTITRYHTIREAVIQVNGRRNYEATGSYAYTDQSNVKHLLALSRIAVDSGYQTYASGIIPDSVNFLLSRNIRYKGKVNLTAANPLLNFEGFAHLSHDCEERLPSDWFSFRGDIDPKGVTIPVKDPKNENFEKLGVGIAMTNDSTGFYPYFLSSKRKNTDPEMISAAGVLSYDSKDAVYKVGAPEKLTAPELPGNQISFNDRNCLISAEGRLAIAEQTGQFSTVITGIALYNTNNDSIGLDVLAGLDFFFTDKALKSMSNAIQSNPTLTPTDDSRPVWIKGIKEMLGTEKAEKLIAEFNLYGSPKKLPSELHQSVVLTDLKMYWSYPTQSFKSKGPIGVGFIGKETVGRKLKGYFEIQRKKGGDVIHLYLEADNANWWYFNYTRGILQAISSDVEFNNAINDLKPEKRSLKASGDLPAYEYMLGTDRKKAEFIRKFNEL